MKEIKRKNFCIKLDPSVTPRKSPNTNIRVLEQILRSQQEQINILSDQLEYIMIALNEKPKAKKRVKKKD